MTKTNFYQPGDRVTAGEIPTDAQWNSWLFDEPQAEFELRFSLMSGFFEAPTSMAVGSAVTLAWPTSKGAMLFGVRINTSGSWTFTSSNASGTYYLMLDQSNNFSQATTQNTALLTVGTVTWDGSSTLSALTLVANATTPGMTIAGVGAGDGGTGTVTQVDGINPNSSGHIAFTFPTGSGWSSIAGALAAIYAAITATVSVAWGNITGIPSSFTPSSHANTHGSSGSDVVSPASIGAVPSSSLLASAAGASTISSSSTDAQIATAKNVYLALLAAGPLTNLGTFNGSTGAITSGGTMPATPSVPNVFYVCNVAGTYNLGGYASWQVGDICMSALAVLGTYGSTFRAMMCLPRLL